MAPKLVAIPGGADPDAKRERPKASTELIGLVRVGAEVFNDPDGETWATTRASHGERRLTLQLRRKPFRNWLAARAYQVLGRAPGESAFAEALAVLEGEAMQHPPADVHVRIAEAGNALYLDLADDAGHIVEIRASGWTVRQSIGPAFWRPKSQRALPMPERGGSLAELRALLNVDDDGFALAAAWLVAALRPGRPAPLLIVEGPQGTAKSTTTEILRSIIDPAAAPVRAAPKTEDNLVVGARCGHVLAYDNLSGIAPELSDALCRLATGGGIAKRVLYTDAEEIVLEALRPVILNGIDVSPERADLLDRSLVLTLRPIPPEARRTAVEVRAELTRIRPQTLGALLDAVVMALRDEASVPGPFPRMADFCRFATAAEPALGLTRGTIVRLLEEQRALGSSRIAESNPLSRALAEWATRCGPRTGYMWKGQATQLLDELTNLVGPERSRVQGFPRAPHTLTKAVRRLAPVLAEQGITVNPDLREGSGAERHRVVSIDARAWHQQRGGTP
jgi:hypothetical protein